MRGDVSGLVRGRFRPRAILFTAAFRTTSPPFAIQLAARTRLCVLISHLRHALYCCALCVCDFRVKVNQRQERIDTFLRFSLIIMSSVQVTQANLNNLFSTMAKMPVAVYG